MKNKLRNRLFALLLCLAMLGTLVPTMAFAAERQTPESVTLTAGEILEGFLPAGTFCHTTDASVAWVDKDGDLRALKAGETTLSAVLDTEDPDATEEITVTVEPYSDGSEIVGNLKLLARYNDSMGFYDGHVYLLFTSYQDGVEITVPDLYGAYEISDQYYADIREDIANGSNHTGTDTDRYFTFTDALSTMTLDRGEIVTIGMYRGFDLTVVQAALGSLQNSSGWDALTSVGKTLVVSFVFDKLLGSGSPSPEEVMDALRQVCAKIGADYTTLLDGVVEGGVCLNRELYNQKLEWDQYENVTYELDITRNQLDTLVASLAGNLNHFSILKNSCATVALRAWNLSVGTRDGEKTAYYLDPAGTGIFSLIDAPKTVRDEIRDKLPGCYLNNAEMVEEPNAGFEDETGWVYVSAPEPVSPVEYYYITSPIRVDDTRTRMSSLVIAGNDGKALSYPKEAPTIGVWIASGNRDGATILSQIDFKIDGKVVSSVQEGTVLPDGIWFKVPGLTLQGDASFYVTDGEGNVLPSVSGDDGMYFFTPQLPVTYRIVKGQDGGKNILQTTITGPEEAPDLVEKTEVYYYDGSDRIPVGAQEVLPGGTTLYIKSAADEDHYSYLLTELTLNGASLMDSYDEEEGAYTAVMPESYSQLVIAYDRGDLYSRISGPIQAFVGDELYVGDYVDLLVGDDGASSDAIKWQIVDEEEDVLGFDPARPQYLTAASEGLTYVWACPEGNAQMMCGFLVEVYASADDMVKVTFDDNDSYQLTFPGEEEGVVDYVLNSGYYIPKGKPLTIVPSQYMPGVISEVSCNGKKVPAGQPIVADEDVDVKVTMREAKVEGMPSYVSLTEKGDSYQLDAKVRYSGLLYQYLPVYDSSLTYRSADPSLVAVSEDGLITVAGDVPEEGAAVYVTAYAGSSNETVFARTKVIVGDYDGARIVGKLTISARPIVKEEPVPHGQTTFTAYGDVDLNVSYYYYYKPTDRYNDLMLDYKHHPENYTSDPALYSDNELGLEDRESYFDARFAGAGSDPVPIHLYSGDSLSFSNYSFDENNDTIMMAILGATPYFENSENAQKLVEQILRYSLGQEFDGPVAFDSLLGTLMEVYVYATITGENPINGHSEGGMTINREMFNQFRRADSQTPNNWYSVEITADELAYLNDFLSDPANNYYSLFTRNCATGAVAIWNATMKDRESLQLKANLTGLGVDTESLYLELGMLRLKQGLDGEGGTNFYPRTVHELPREEKDDPEVIAPVAKTNLKANGTDQALVIPGSAVGGTMVYVLGEEDPAWSETVPTGRDAGTYYVWYMVRGDETHNDTQPVCVPVTIAAGSSDKPGGGGGGGGSAATTYPVTLPKDITGAAVTVEPSPAKPGAKVVVTVEPEEGYTDNGVTVTDSKGEPLAVAENGDGSYTFIMPSSSVTVTPDLTKDEPAPAPGDTEQFTDVPRSAWYHDPVYWTVDNGIMMGVTETLFAPHDPATRAMVVTMLWRMAGESDAAPSAFTDVTPGSWYAKAVDWGVETGVVKGTADTTFSPNDSVTREQLAALLYRYAQDLGQGFTGAWAFPLNFPDAGQVSAYAYEAMCWMTMKEIIRGMGDGTLSPQGTATRAQIAAMFQRFCETIA